MSDYPVNPVFEGNDVKDAQGRLLNVVGAQDWLGGTFKVGDQVMYCIAAGRGQMMAIGTIQKMRAKLLNNRWTGDYWRIEVQVITEKTSGAWGNEKRTRPAWVNPMNITSMVGVVDTGADVV